MNILNLFLEELWREKRKDEVRDGSDTAGELEVRDC